MTVEGKTVRELVTAIKDKEISPVEVASYYLEQTERKNGEINAFVTMNDKLLAEAKEAEAAVMRGEETGILHGIPVGIKDLTPVKGMRTTFGSPAYKDHIADRDATIVKRLRQAGALIMGKTNTPEFGHKGTTDNMVFGATVNPWDHSKTAGGSSGGAAVAQVWCRWQRGVMEEAPFVFLLACVAYSVLSRRMAVFRWIIILAMYSDQALRS